MVSALSFVGSVVSQLCSVQLPWGISFGVVVVGFVTMPLLVVVLKKLL